MYLTQSLHRAVQQHPERPAVRAGATVRSYREFVDRVARLAGALQKLGMQPGDRVAMLALNSDRYMEYQFAVPWGGGALNPCNIRWSAAEILYSLDDCASTILLVDDSFKAMAEGFRGQAKTLREIVYCGSGEVPAGMHGYEALIAAHAPVPDAARRGADLAGVFYTGGTTGFPKGVMLSHDNMGSSAMALCCEGVAEPGGCYLHAAPMFHLADMGIAAAQWVMGSTHSFVPAFNPEAVLQAIERDRVTHVLLVPTMIQMLVDHPAMQQGRDLSSLKWVLYGASPIAEAVLDRAMAALPGVNFVQAYGMTELSPLATLNPAWFHTAEGRKRGKLRAAGRASYCTEVRIVDAQDRTVPTGEVGEIVARGPQLMRGYWNLPEASHEALRGGWMHTGDAGRMDAEGYVYISDRVKDMIVSGGENVYPREVEEVLFQHPAIADVAVIGVPDEKWGESVKAIVVLREGAAAEAAALLEHCQGRLAGYKRPRSVDFVAELPRNPSGKVLKRELREPYWKGQGRRVS